MLVQSLSFSWPMVGRHRMLSLFRERRRIMNTFLKTWLLLAVAGGFFASEAAMAKPSYLDGSAKARGDYGKTSSSTSRQSRPCGVYRSAPATVRPESSSDAAAQAPTQERSFSYEPSQQQQSSSGCGCNTTTEQAPATTRRSTQTYRSYSYEPSMGSSPRRMQSSRAQRSSRTPSYLLQKTDPGKYRN